MSLFPETLNARLDHPHELPAGKTILLEGEEEYGLRIAVDLWRQRQRLPPPDPNALDLGA